MATRRIIFERSRKSILRRMSSLVVCSSAANISIVLERPSDSKFNNSSITRHAELVSVLHKETPNQVRGDMDYQISSPI